MEWSYECCGYTADTPDELREIFLSHHSYKKGMIAYRVRREEIQL